MGNVNSNACQNEWRENTFKSVEKKMKNKKYVYDICQEKLVSGKDIPCYAKRGALCRKVDDADCLLCKYFPKAKEEK